MEKGDSQKNASFFKKERILFRPRVNELLKKASESSLVTVTAGTGYGKSQAVSSFIENDSLSAVWVQLTQLDNYPTRFWDIFTYAVRSKSPTLADHMVSTGFPDTMERLYSFLKEVAQDVYTQEPFILVLDDFHKIHDSSIINLIETIALAGIEHLTIFLISRYPLMLDYARLKEEGLLGCIDVGDLRFTQPETLEYFNLIDLSFTAEEGEGIYAATEGWPLAIYLIGLQSRKQGRPFSDPVACTIPSLYKLIEQEIFSQYSKQIQHIFIKLSVMERIPLGLMSLISGSLFADMAELMRHNMFVDYNEQTENYLFHRIFRRFLQERQVLLNTTEMERLHILVGDWHFDQKNSIEALIHYQKSGSYAKMWNVIRSYGAHGYSGEYAALCLKILNTFPPEYVETVPVVDVMRAHLLMHANEIQTAHHTLLDVIDRYKGLALTDTRRQVLGEAYLGLAFTNLMRLDRSYTDCYLKAAEYLPSGSQLIDTNQSYVGNNPAITIFSSEKGSVAQSIADAFRVFPKIVHVMNGCGYGVEYLIAAEGNYYQGKFEEASEYAHKAIYYAKQKDQHDIIMNGFTILGRIGFCLGNYDGSIGYLSQIQRYVAEMKQPYLFGVDAFAAGWFYTKLGQFDKVPRSIITNMINTRYQSIIVVGREKIAHALYLLYQEQYFELLGLTDYIEQLYSHRGLNVLVLQTLVIKAICYLRLGRAEETLKAFKQAYELSYGNDLVVQYIECGYDACELIDFVLDTNHDMDKGWLHSLRERSYETAKNQQSVRAEYQRQHQDTAQFFPNLTQNEHALLCCLCDGLNQDQIAETLGVSAKTVKTLLKKIYGKLGAINRAEAIRITLDHHLLD